MTGAEVFVSVGARYTADDRRYTSAVGLQLRNEAGVSILVTLPYVLSTGNNPDSGVPVDTQGMGDMSLSATIEPLRLLRKSEPRPNGIALAMTATLMVPTGRATLKDGSSALPARFQPGRGVWTPGLSIALSTRAGATAWSLSGGYMFGTGQNSASYEYAPHLAWESGIARTVGGGNWATRVALVGDVALAADMSNGYSIGGTKGESISAKIGVMRIRDRGCSFGVVAEHAFVDTHDNAQAGSAASIFASIGF